MILMLLVCLIGRRVLVLARIFLVGSHGVLAACYVTNRWFTPNFSLLAFVLVPGLLVLFVLLLVGLFGLHTGWYS